MGLAATSWLGTCGTALAVPSLLGCRASGATTSPATLDGPALSSAATAVERLSRSFSSRQRDEIALPFGHADRLRIDANWAVTSPSIGSRFYTAEQRYLIAEVLRNSLSPQGYRRVKRQMSDDAGGLGGYHAGLFESSSAVRQTQLLLSGRHLTLRASANAEEPSHRGPLVFGHGETGAERNLYFEHTRRAHGLLRALTPSQQGRALLEEAPYEEEVELRATGFSGVALGELAPPQLARARQLLEGLLVEYAGPLAAALRASLALGGIENLHFCCYREDDLSDDGIWDLWRMEGPRFVWHFRGAPHVHAFVNFA